MTAEAPPSAITLTIAARDIDHARRILEAVGGLEQPRASNELVVGPADAPPPGHTYRELCEARRAGLLDAVMTRKGLVFTPAALEAYRAVRAERRRRANMNVVEEKDTYRLRALTNAGLLPRGNK